MMGYTIRTIRTSKKSLARISAITLPFTMILMAIFVGPLAHAQTSDFALTATPAYLCVNPGVEAQSVIGVQSMGGFAGTVNLGDSVDPPVTNAPTLSQIPASATLVSGQSIEFNLTMYTALSTPSRVYTITVQGLSGANYNYKTIQLTVSSDCSVGGTTLPANVFALIAPYMMLGAAAVAATGLVIGGLAYRTRRGKSANATL
jgi:hypothetical protein